ncbi:cupin domain-containing protein [Balneatrix alpica]|uniref:Cupin domain-containing protein n=1 Tax=Balneatrix alpica TaxID=75684 RepID=A0ABV5ZCF1_9GAMM|nr:cupin domain-containing protein [Balneatrix alpica]
MPKTIADLVSFADASTPASIDFPKPERLVKGNPQRTTWNHYSDSQERFHSGVWECEPGAWEVYYDENEDEFCYIVEGRFRLHDQQGQYKEFQAGDAFVIPGGFCGVWETLEKVKKLYVIASKA